MSSSIPVEIKQNTMAGQQRPRISELQFDKFPATHSFLCWKMRFQNQMTTCSDFSLDNMLWINKVEMVDSLEELKSSRSVAGKNFQNFQMLDANIWLSERCTSVGLCIAGRRARRNLQRFHGRAQKFWDQFDEYGYTRAALRQANIRENKRPSLNKIQVKDSHQRSPYAVKFEDRSQEEIERQERCARGDAWRLAENIF